MFGHGCTNAVTLKSYSESESAGQESIQAMFDMNIPRQTGTGGKSVQGWINQLSQREKKEIA